MIIITREKWMKICVYYSKNNTRKNQIIKAIRIMNGMQNYFYYKLEQELDTDICEERYVNWENFCKNNRERNTTYCIYITEKPFDDNWFSHEEAQFSVITTNGWEEKFAPPSLKAYLVYQIAQASINFEGDLNEKMEMRIVHDNAEGCMFDLCINKCDIKLGMIAGNICPQCRSVLVRYGIGEKALNAIERMLGVYNGSVVKTKI